MTQVMHTVTGTRVHADGTPISNAQPAIFDLTIGPNGEVRYVDTAKVGDLDHVAYGVTHLTWQTNEVPETLSISGTAMSPVSDNEVWIVGRCIGAGPRACDTEAYGYGAHSQVHNLAE